MSLIYIPLIVIAVLVALNILMFCLFNSVMKDKKKLENEINRVQDDLEYYINLEKIKKEGVENYNEKSKDLHSGDVHSRNATAADILRSHKN